MTKLFFRPIAVLCLAGLLPAQNPAMDPSQEIQEIARRIDEQLQEIDKLLLETSKPSQGGARDQKQLLQTSRERSESVEQGIDQLILKLNEMKSRCNGGGQCDNPGDNPGENPSSGQAKNQQAKGQQPQGQQRNRQEGTTPEFVPQDQEPKNQTAQQQEPKDAQGKPIGGEQNPEGGENRDAAAQPDHATAPGQPGVGEGEWGNLQPYLNGLKNRGSSPKVQDKYRRFWEAYVKARSNGSGK